MKKIFLLIIVSNIVLYSAAQHYSNKQPVSKEKLLNDQYATGIFKSQEGTILDLTNDNTVNTYTNVLQWMQGRVAGVQIYRNRYGVLVPYIRGSRASVYVDEVPVDADFLSMLATTDIAMIKIIKTPFYGGFNGGGGAIAIYTLRGEDEK
jgi:hypothetical protein